MQSEGSVAYACSGSYFRGGVSRRFTRHPKGQSTVEYVLIVAIIVLVVLIVGPWVSSAIRNHFDTVTETLDEGTSGIAFKDPVDIPDPKRGTAFAVYSADDNSLMFYKRRGVPKVGDMFNNRRVTEVYTGFEATVYRKTFGTHSMLIDAEYNTPWFDRRNDIKAVKVADSGIKPKSIANWFARFESVKSIDLTLLDASNVQSMSCTFSWCKLMNTIDLNDSFATVPNLVDTFYYCMSLESLDLSCLRSGMGRNFWGTFAGCEALKTLALSPQTVIDDMSYAFCGCVKLNYDCSDWNVDKANTKLAGLSASFSKGIIRPKAWQ